MALRAAEILNEMYGDAARIPLIFGHSGAQAYAPSNTLPAFELAAQLGAHGTELDVSRSKDGYAVVIHDLTVDAKTNGSGRVADLTLAELKALDAGGWFAPEFAGVTIPTLDEVFDAVGKRLLINIEIKSQTQATDGVEQVVADGVVRHAMQQRVMVSSFNPLALRRFRNILPDVPLGFLYGKDSPPIAHQLMEGFAVEALHPEHDLIDQALIDKAHAAGQHVHAWTINDPERAKQLVALGTYLIMTDAPDRLLAAF